MIYMFSNILSQPEVKSEGSGAQIIQRRKILNYFKTASGCGQAVMHRLLPGKH